MEVPPDDVVLREAERKVAEAAIAWANSRDDDEKAAELRAAVFMLRKARQITGKIRVSEILRELEATDAASRAFPAVLFVVLDTAMDPVFTAKERDQAVSHARLGHTIV